MVLPDLSVTIFENDALNTPDAASVDHIIPKSEGGRNTIDNIVVACRQCNSSRGSRPLTAEQDARFQALQDKRKGELRHVGIIVPESFGDLTPGSVYLADLLNRVEGRADAIVGHTVSRTITKYLKLMAGLDDVRKFDIWYQLALLLTDSCCTKAEVLPEPYLNLVKNHLRNLMLERARRKRPKGSPIQLSEKDSPTMDDLVDWFELELDVDGSLAT